jgi:hypothetical protein
MSTVVVRLAGERTLNKIYKSLGGRGITVMGFLSGVSWDMRGIKLLQC